MPSIVYIHSTYPVSPQEELFPLSTSEEARLREGMGLTQRHTPGKQMGRPRSEPSSPDRGVDGLHHGPPPPMISYQHLESLAHNLVTDSMTFHAPSPYLCLPLSLDCEVYKDGAGLYNTLTPIPQKHTVDSILPLWTGCGSVSTCGQRRASLHSPASDALADGTWPAGAPPHQLGSVPAKRSPPHPTPIRLLLQDFPNLLSLCVLNRHDSIRLPAPHPSLSSG